MKLITTLLTLMVLTSITNSNEIEKQIDEGTRVGGRTQTKRSVLGAVSKVKSVLEVWNLVDDTLQKSLKNIDGTNHFQNMSLGVEIFRKQAILTNQILLISKHLDQIEASLAYNRDYTISSLLSAIPKMFETEFRIHELKSVITQINLQNEEIKGYLNHTEAIERHTLENWAGLASGHSADSIKNLMGRLHTAAYSAPGDPYKKNVFQLIREGDSKSSMCDVQQSQQEVIYQLYNMVALAELKGYTMLQFAWMLLKVYEKGTFTTESEMMRKLYKERIAQKIDAVREAMTGADRSTYRCDPKKWVEGENYIALTQLLQGYIENEVNLNPDKSCLQDCSYYSDTKYYGCYSEQHCSHQQQCNGKVLKCTYYDSDMHICHASSNDRRYNWVEYKNGKILGRKGTCANQNMYKVDSWWRSMFWHCSYCFCLCDDNHPGSDRYFSLRNVTSDVANNKVITGVRFQKINQVVHIQIQQSFLEPRGIINTTAAEWVPIKPFKVEDGLDGVDFHTMKFEERGVDLDDAYAPSTLVLTGLRFRKLASRINLEVQTTPYDFATGKVRPMEESLWIGNDNTENSLVNPRSEVKLNDPDVPTMTNNHVPDSKHNQFIRFRESSVSKDAAQSTVPYIDAQPIESQRLALSGLGLLHRGAPDSGGILALKIITLDMSINMVSEAPEESHEEVAEEDTSLPSRDFPTGGSQEDTEDLNSTENFY